MKKKFVCILIFLLMGCQGEKKDIATEKTSPTYLTQHRAEKDSLFRTAVWSPIKEQEKSSFQGLNYFAFNGELRFSGPIHYYDNPQTTRIYATKTGDVRPAKTFGYFPFEYKGIEYRLEILKMYSKNDTSQTFLFLGFTDETTGNETYGAGRYIDLEENSANYYTVDFNYAYSPYCAYNEKYSCALPPAKNRLPFKVSAGEKIYQEH